MKTNIRYLQGRRHQILTGGRIQVRETQLPTNSNFSSVFGHFISKTLKNLKKKLYVLLNFLQKSFWGDVPQEFEPEGRVPLATALMGTFLYMGGGFICEFCVWKASTTYSTLHAFGKRPLHTSDNSKHLSNTYTVSIVQEIAQITFSCRPLAPGCSHGAVRATGPPVIG